MPEVPLVLSDAVESVSKTSKALEVLKKIGAVADVEKAKDSKSLRRGKGELPAFVAWLGLPESHGLECLDCLAWGVQRKKDRLVQVT